jgi:peptidoglycan hydrolase-like protein with peptidoglycan-binding domain
MSVPVLRPGDTDDAVPRMKRVLVRELLKLGLRPVAERVVVDSTTYGSAAVNAVEKFQARRHLRVDGVVGEDTWRALGIVDSVADGLARVSIAPSVDDGPPGDRILEAALILAGMPAATARAEARAAGLFDVHAGLRSA